MKKVTQRKAQPVTQQAKFTELVIVIGSVTGTAEGTARYIAKNLPQYLGTDATTDSHRLLSANATITLTTQPQVDELADASNASRLWLFCVSNTGQGVLPDHLHPFMVELSKTPHSLQHCHYLLINFGDSSFRTFGQSGRTLKQALYRKSANCLAEPLLIDAMRERYPKIAALKWLTGHIQ